MEMCGRPWCLCLLLMLAVLAAGFGEEAHGTVDLSQGSHQSPELGEAEGNDGVMLMPGLVRPEAEDDSDEIHAALTLGKQSLDSYESIQNGLLGRAKELRREYDHPVVPAVGVTYTKIPGMAMRRKGTAVVGQTRVNCENVCNAYEACLSYSYNSAREECIWAQDGFHYSTQSTFYLKTRAANGQMTLNYQAMPGLMIHNEKGHMGETQEECKYGCSENQECSGFSYTASNKECRFTKPKFIEFDEHWDYYEKDQVHRVEPKENPVDESLAEAKEKKDVFMRQTSQMKEIRAEQSAKAQKNREHLRSKALAIEKKYKTLTDQHLMMKAAYDKEHMRFQVGTGKLASDTATLHRLQRDDSKVEEALQKAKVASKAAPNKELQEKAEIDVQYLAKKLITSRRQAKAMETELTTFKPSERRGKDKFKEKKTKKQKADEKLEEMRIDVDAAEFRVDVASKEKDTKRGLATIAALKEDLVLESLKRPLDQGKIDATKEKLLKEKSAQHARVSAQQKFQARLDELLEANKERFEQQAKGVAKRVAKKAAARKVELAAKKAEANKKKALEVGAKKAAEVKKKKASEQGVKEDQAKKIKAAALEAAKKQEKMLADEEAKKAGERDKMMKEKQAKDKENAILVAREKKEKADKMEQEEKEVVQKLSQVRKFKKGLEVSNKAEEKAEEEKKQAQEKLKKEEKAAEVAKNVEMAKNFGLAKMKEEQAKRAAVESDKKVKQALELVRQKKIQKANDGCNKQCQAEGRSKENKPPQFMGCFNDNQKSPAFHTFHAAFDVNTVEWCNQKCALQSPSFTVFGLQENKCSCGSADDSQRFDRYGMAAAEKCILECPGNFNQLCGGPLVNRVYTVGVPPKTYTWAGHVKNASRPVENANFNFVLDECQCFGTPDKVANNTISELEY